MHSIRAYHPSPLQDEGEIQLASEAVHHLQRVLRVREGAQLEVFDGCGGWAVGIWLGRDDLVEVTSSGRAAAPKCAFHLGLGISERDRMDYAVQKSSELGVAEITPLHSRYALWNLSGARAERRLVHWQTIAVQAVRQSGGYWVPQIHSVERVDAWTQGLQAVRKVLLDTEAPAVAALKPEAVSSVALAVGPKGGWATQELELMAAQGFESLRLGPRILRTETAPVAALTVLQWFWGDLNCTDG